MEKLNLLVPPAHGMRLGISKCPRKSSLDAEVAGDTNASPSSTPGLTIRSHFYLQDCRGNNY